MEVDRKALARADGPVLETRERFPDFFIVGHAKSGTTALYEMLRRHPQVFMPERKEPWFFATRHAPALPAARLGGGRLTTNRGVPVAVRAGAGQGSAPARRPRPTCGRARRPRAIADAQPGRAHHRDPARARQLPALAASAAAADTRRGPSGTFARRSRSRRPGAKAGSVSHAARTARSCCSTPTTCATSSSCAATTRCSRPSRCWC